MLWGVDESHIPPKYMKDKEYLLSVAPMMDGNDSL